MRIYVLMATYSHLYSSGGTIAKATYEILQERGICVKVISTTDSKYAAMSMMRLHIYHWDGKFV